MAPSMDNPPDYMRRWQRARKTMLKHRSLYDQLISSTAKDSADYERLLGSTPERIVDNFISRSIQG